MNMEKGMVIKNWVIITPNYTRQNNRTVTECMCLDCRKISYTYKEYFSKSNMNIKCKYCEEEKEYQLLGATFGHMVILEYSHSDKKCGKIYKCLCTLCGTVKNVPLKVLKSGKSTSCGCVWTKHGLANTKIYKRYMSIKKRCYNPNASDYYRYGGRGIYMCDEWLGDNGFMNFYTWSMNNGYRDELTINRKDNDGPYAPYNCEWVDLKTQARNKSTNTYFNVFGEILCIVEICEKYNITRSSIKNALSRGRTIEELIIIKKGVDNL